MFPQSSETEVAPRYKLLSADTVDTADMFHTVDIIHTIDMVYTVDVVYAVDMVYSIEIREMRGEGDHYHSGTRGNPRLRAETPFDCRTLGSRSISKLTVACGCPEVFSN